MTNNTRVQLVLFINSSLLAMLAFGVGLTETQIAAIMVPVNLGLGLAQSLTYKISPKRIDQE